MSGISAAQELKGLQSQLSKESSIETVLKDDVSAAQRKHALALSRVKFLQERVAALTSAAAKPIVSEHAMLRYLQRVNGLGLDALRDEILTPDAEKSIQFAKSCVIKRGAVSLVVRDNVVVTVE